MELLPRDPSLNLLPRDDIVNYHGPILSPHDAGDCFEALMTTIPWKHDEAIIYGKHIVTARKVAWYGDCAKQPILSRRDNADRSLARSAWDSATSKEPPVGCGMIGRSPSQRYFSS
jgi:hypothetical protein